ncbi:condensation domain-containing protein [Actinosynnema sp. NPDC023794]
MSATWPASLWQRFALSFDADRPGVATGPAFTINASLRVEGDFDPGLLVAATRDLVARHDLLRSRLDREAVVQVVEASAAADVDVLDDPAEVAVPHRPVSSDAVTPLAVRVARRSPREHVLSAHLHHLMGDPATLWRLLDDLGALYTARCGGPEPDAPTGQYGEYAAFEAELENAGRAENEAWWNRQLDKVPLAAPPASTRGDRYAKRRPVLAPEELADLEARARALRGSPFAALMAVLAEGMAEHTVGGDRVAFCTLFLRRDHPRWRTMAGPVITPAYLVIPFDAPSDVRGLAASMGAAQRFSRYPVWTLERMAGEKGAYVPFVELIPQLRPVAIPFGPARAFVEHAAGQPDDGRAKNLGLRFRKTTDGSLTTHLSGDGVGWTEPAVDAVLDGLAARVPALGRAPLPAR